MFVTYVASEPLQKLVRLDLPALRDLCYRASLRLNSPK